MDGLFKVMQNREPVIASVEVEYPARHVLNFVGLTKGMNHHFIYFFYFPVGCRWRQCRDLPSLLAFAVHSTAADIAEPADSMLLCGHQKTGCGHDIGRHHRFWINLDPCAEVIGAMDDGINRTSVSGSSARTGTQAIKIGPIFTVEFDQFKICMGRDRPP